MAERRMFAKSIVLSDAFLDMPLSARCLYFTLGMLADDDGFVGSPKAIMRQCGASQDDMLILLQKRYVLDFDSGVIVIKHWHINNYLQKDRRKDTTYLEELSTLMMDEKGSYTEKEKDVDSNNYIETKKEKKPLTDAQRIRAEVKKQSSLPYTFDQQIRNAFIGEICPICGVVMSHEFSPHQPSIQHNIPISKGGKHEIDNISVICRSCNSAIQNREITPPYNTDLVREKWECIGNVYTDKIRLDKVSEDKDNEIDTNVSICAKEPHEPKNVYDEIVTHWNTLPGNIARLTKISKSGTRKKLLDARINEYGIDQIHAAIEEIPKSDFLMGGGNQGWTISFDWFIKPSNFPKVLEGNYRGKKQSNSFIERWKNA